MAACCAGQNTGPGETKTLKVKVQELEVSSIVEDRHTAPVRGLTKADFAVTIDGVAASVRSVGTDASVPLNVALLLDVSLSQKGMLALYAAAVRGLQASLDKERDQISIYTFAGSVRLYQDWTAAGNVDAAAIEHLDTKRGLVLQKNSFLVHGGTRLFDAMGDAVERSGGREGRRAVLILTDGIDEGSDTTAASVARIADRGNVSISALEFAPSAMSVLSPKATFKLLHDTLALASEETGGVFVHGKKGEEEQQMRAIIDAIKEQYLLYVGFSGVNGFHTVSVAMAQPRPGVVVRGHRKVWLQNRQSE